MKSFVIRWAINSVAMWVAVELLSGTHIFPQSSDLTGIIIMALIFGLVNAIIRPLVMVLSCPLIVLTLGLGTLLVNTGMFALAGWIGTSFGYGFEVNGFWGAFLGALIVSVVSFILSLFFRGSLKEK
ncbi:MAG TPA: phage holin family protein [Anaerolineaceae bacterium]|jgi:putative membrane protein|nr:phage holin family protein [Anaerolineaceae bacterium]HOD44316.1 phage holin family protein [Anaerolineaceae bacterium]HOH20537.1 phage holin family protein [Anaerolineaceae bacterium]HOU44768.1 phage holin family protein [Anaerolineaceae bacterium]HPA32888.1 phage holin family protein [Anaerolineaceae bacterium]